MKRIYFLLFLSCESLVIFSQGITLTEPQKALQKHSFHYTIGSNEKYFYVRNRYTFKVVYQKFEFETGKLIGEMSNLELPKDYYSIDNHVNSDGLYIVACNFNKKVGVNNIKTFLVDFNTVKLVEKQHITVDIGKNNVASVRNNFHSSKSGKFLICTTEWEQSKEDKKKIVVNVLDSSLTILKSVTLKFPRKESINNFTVIDDGRIYFRRTNRDNENYICVIDTPKNYEYWEEKLNNTYSEKHNYISNVKIIQDHNHDIILLGLHINEHSGFEHIYYYKINADFRECVEHKYISYGDNLKKSFILKDDKKKDDSNNLKNFTGLRYILTEANHIIILAEEHWVKREPIGSGNIASVDRYSHYFRNLLLFELDSKGKLIFQDGFKKSLSRYFTGADNINLFPEIFSPISYNIKLIENRLNIYYPDGNKYYDLISKSINDLPGFTIEDENFYGFISDMKIVDDKNIGLWPLHTDKSKEYSFAIVKLK